VASTRLLALAAQRFSTRSHGRCGGLRPAAELVNGHTLAASARSAPSDRYGDSMSVQGSRGSAGYGRRRLRLLPGSFSPSHRQSRARLRWISAQGGVQRSVPRRDSEARTGYDLPAFHGSKNKPLLTAEGETVRVDPPTFRLPCQPGLLSFPWATAPSGTGRHNRGAVILNRSVARRVVDGR
jgi:hypothetical protein